MIKSTSTLLYYPLLLTVQIFFEAQILFWITFLIIFTKIRDKVQVDKTSPFPLLWIAIETFVPSQEIGWSCICVVGVWFLLSFLWVFRLDFRAVLIKLFLFGPSWSQSYGIWIYNYLCNQSLSPLALWVRIPLRRRVIDITLCDKVCQ
jgi:hypothetical protein